MSLGNVVSILSEERKRESGIHEIGAVPWGTHLCCFYETKEELLKVLVPYFKAGLENNESCIWVTSEPFADKEAEDALMESVPDFAQYLEGGQIEIIPYTKWYLKGGVFKRQRVLNAWVDKVNQALDKGYDGLRVTGDTTWLERKDWSDWIDYEEELNNVIGNYHMLVICTYSLAKYRGNDIIDVVSEHQGILIKRARGFMLIKQGKNMEMSSPTYSRGKRPLTPLQERFVKSGLEGFNEREAMELLLSLCPGGVSEQVLDKCLTVFKNVRGLLSATPQELRRVGYPAQLVFYLRLLHDIPAEVLREKIIDRPVYESSQEIFDYLYYSMRDLKYEVFKVIYLDKRDQIIDVVDLFEGTLDSTPIRPREIVETAIERSTAALIFVHNHTSGDPAPSGSDKRLTRDLVFIGNILQIRVLDHIIIGEDRYFSFADEGLIQKYEDDFLNIRIRRIL